MPESAVPAYITSLIRHFADLRDGTHGGSASRKDKEAHFENAVQLLAPVARQVLTEMNTSLLLDTGQLTETGLRRTADGGLIASWVLSWPEQQAAGVEPIARSEASVTTWQDDDAQKLEAKMTEIAVQLILTAEIDYREDTKRPFEWRVQRKAEVEEEQRKQKLEAEPAERERRNRIEQGRVNRLLKDAAAF